MEDFAGNSPRTESEYLDQRVLDQINWYDKKSGFNKRWFLGLKVTEVIVALFIPFLSGYIGGGNDPIKVTVGLLGIIVAAIAGLITLIKFQENWIEYRSISESLKHEKFLFLAKAGPYAEPATAFPLFVERFESLISTSTKKWVDYVVKKDDAKS